ncbi:MAG: hypothetical protein WCD70_12455 [Alphaproteobacteria bacterium]
MKGTSSTVCAFIVVLIVLMFPFSVSAQENLVLHYAGVALSGESKDSKVAFPNTQAFMDMKEPGGKDPDILDNALNQHLAGLQFDGFTLNHDLGNSDKGDSLSLAFVVTWENVAKEQIGSKYKVTYDLRAEALVFDFHTKTIIAAYPFGMQRHDVSPNAPTQIDKQNAFRKMYLDPQNSILDTFVRTLQTARIRRSYGAYAQVVDVSFEPKALDMMASLEEASPERAKDFIATAFETSLMKNASIPILPHVIGQAIGNQMAIKFANANVYNLTLPKSDFRITITVHGFKKVPVDENTLETGFAYANYMKVNISQPLMDAPYLDGDFKFAVSKTVPKTVLKTDDWAAYQESILSFMDGLTKQFSSSDSDWLDKWGNDSVTSSQIEDAAQALSRCK